jgi:RNA polymerase sigma-70 factor (ECF subfamily)
MSSSMTDGSDFESHRRHLTGLAYRMLGSIAEAEDVVQDAYLRWHSADRAGVRDVRAFLSRVAIRLSLDRLKSAKVRREHYVGPWLPEPVVKDAPADDPLDLSMTLMLALERLSPLERAAFLLHDVFDADYAEVARVLDRSEAACRQLAARAREHVRESRPRFPVDPEEGARIASAFLDAARTGDAALLTSLLAEDAVLHSDGGGKRPAALAPIVGRDKVTRFFVGIARKSDPAASTFIPARINGLPGFILEEPDGSISTTCVEIRDGLVAAIYAVRNPDKLRHLTR